MGNPEDTVHELLYDFLPTGAKYCVLSLYGEDAEVRCSSLAIALQFTFDERLHNVTYPPLSLITSEWCEDTIEPLIRVPPLTRLSHNWRPYEEAIANKTDLDIANDLKWELQEEQFVMQIYFFVFNPSGVFSMPFLYLNHVFTIVRCGDAFRVIQSWRDAYSGSYDYYQRLNRGFGSVDEWAKLFYEFVDEIVNKNPYSARHKELAGRLFNFPDGMLGGHGFHIGYKKLPTDFTSAEKLLRKVINPPCEDRKTLFYAGENLTSCESPCTNDTETRCPIRCNLCVGANSSIHDLNQDTSTDRPTI